MELEKTQKRRGQMSGTQHRATEQGRRSWGKAEEEGGCLAIAQAAELCQVWARSKSCSIPIMASTRQSPWITHCHPRPTIGVFVAGLAMLRRDRGTSLTVRGAFTAVELSHWRWPWQVFNDLDFNWMGGEGD